MGKKQRQIRWTNKTLAELSKLDYSKGLEVLYNCGASCASDSELLAGAKKVADELGPDNDPDLLFNKYKTDFYNTPRLGKSGNRITLVFEECTCPMVKDGVDNPYICNCTVGYTKKIFETLFNRNVIVELEKSILKGDKICKQHIYFIEENNKK